MDDRKNIAEAFRKFGDATGQASKAFEAFTYRRFDRRVFHLTELARRRAPRSIIASAALEVVEAYHGGKLRALRAIAAKYASDWWIDRKIWWWLKVRRLTEDEIDAKITKM